MDVAVYKIDGSQAGTMTIPEGIFAVEINPGLVHEAVVAQEANSRTRYAQTKDRSEVRGGGRKPWKQKGTGRARHGSRRSPIWIGGGITFGPVAERVFGKKINKRAKQKALRMVLTDKVKENQLVVVEDLNLPEAKTKHVVEMRSKLPGADASALIVADQNNEGMKKAARNIEKTATISAHSINVRDLLKYQYTIVSKAALEAIIKQYSK